jgi:hypothetical protein
VVVVVDVVPDVPLVLVAVVMLVSVAVEPVPDVSVDMVVLVPVVSVLIVPVVPVTLVSVEEVVVTVEDVSVVLPVSVLVLFSCLQAKPKRPRAATVRKTRIVFFMLFPFCCFVVSGVICIARAEVACLTSLLILTIESRARPFSRGIYGVSARGGSNTGATGG